MQPGTEIKPSVNERYYGRKVVANKNFFIVRATGRFYIYDACSPYRLLNTVKVGRSGLRGLSIGEDNTIVAGSSNVFGWRKAGVFIYKHLLDSSSPGKSKWVLQHTIKYSSISTRNHPFGYSTTIKKNTIVVTASYYPGIVYVFSRNTTDGTWNTTHPFKITAPSLAYSRFGWNDAGISDDERQIFIGADTRDKVFIYKLDANNKDWFLKQTLSPRDISIPISISISIRGIWFGWSLSVQGNTLTLLGLGGGHMAPLGKHCSGTKIWTGPEARAFGTLILI